MKDAQVIEVPQVKKPAALVPAQKSQQQEYKTIAPEQLSADAIQTGAGKLVIVIGQEPFNMTMMTANSGGSLGKVNGKPVVFSILSPDQPYEQMEKAESYTIRFYPTGQTEPTVILECKKLAFTGNDGRYATHVCRRNSEKQWSNDRTRRPVNCK